MSCVAPARNLYRLVGDRLGGVALLLIVAPFAPLAHADEERSAPPPDFNVRACQEMVRHEGRMIAWARWEQGFPLQKTRSAKLADGAPRWAVELVRTWIGDAYAWRVSDANVRQWAQELGNADNLPKASQLTPHETIAIWLRRIARDCDARKGEDAASAPAISTAGSE
jgi:hypothetical protein